MSDKRAHPDTSDAVIDSEDAGGSVSSAKRQKIEVESGVDVDVSQTETQTQQVSGIKLRKRHMGIVFGYIGTNYQGLQINRDVESIEGVLEPALARSGGIAECNRASFKKVNWVRASRTDKGVHAIQQIVSLNLLMTHETYEEQVEAINKELPNDIRVFCLLKVPKRFNPKNNSSGRVYEYVLPTFAFDINAGTSTTSGGTRGLIDPFHQYRVDGKVIGLVNDALKLFVGTKRYHNYTPLKEVSLRSDSACRYITKAECSDPYVIRNMEFVTIQICGQSFLLNQIRKMVGAVLFAVRHKRKRVCEGEGKSESEYEYEIDSDRIEASFKRSDVRVPMAPGHGLMLVNVDYKGYSELRNVELTPIKLSESDGGDGDGKRKVIEAIRVFKERVMDHIAELEIYKHIMRTWIKVNGGFNETYPI